MFYYLENFVYHWHVVWRILFTKSSTLRTLGEQMQSSPALIPGSGSIPHPIWREEGAGWMTDNLVEGVPPQLTWLRPSEIQVSSWVLDTRVWSCVKLGSGDHPTWPTSLLDPGLLPIYSGRKANLCPVVFYLSGLSSEQNDMCPTLLALNQSRQWTWKYIKEEKCCLNGRASLDCSSELFQNFSVS